MKRRRFSILSLMAITATVMLPIAITAQSGKSPTEPGAVSLPVTTQSYMVRGNPPIYHFVAEATNNTGVEIPQGTKIYWKCYSLGYGTMTLFNSVPPGGKIQVIHYSNPNGPAGSPPSGAQAWFYKQ